jgi:hypothetical protein
MPFAVVLNNIQLPNYERTGNDGTMLRNDDERSLLFESPKMWHEFPDFDINPSARRVHVIVM